MAISQQVLDASHVAGGAWRQVNNATGLRQMSISGEGVFEDSAAEENLRAKAFGGTSANYELRFGNGDKISGAFLVSDYLQQGEVQDVQHFSLTLESAGAISFVAG
jgi:predicted secreted protein